MSICRSNSLATWGVSGPGTMCSMMNTRPWGLIRVEFFVTARIMDTFAFLEIAKPLLPPAALSGGWQGPLCPLVHGTVPLSYGRPGFGQKAALRQWVMAEQHPHQGKPTAAKDAHQPPLRCPARASVSWTLRRHVGQRPLRHGGIDHATNTHHPQSGHGDCPPQACRPRGVGHARAVPLPACPLREFKALLNPGPHAVPGGVTDLRFQIRQDQPGVLIARLPAGQQRTVELPGLASEGRASALP